MNLQNNEKQSPVILRVLNTALAGCEYSLQGKTLFVVGDENTLATVATELTADEAARIICLPVDAADSAVNFEIIVEATTPSAVKLRELRPAGSDEYAAALQQIITVGAVRFALRREDQAWDAAVLAPAADAVTGKPVARQGGRKLAVAGIVLLLLGSVAAGSLAWVTRQDRQIVSLSDQIKRGVAHYQIYVGRDMTKYILVDNDRDYDWVQQSLVKMPAEFSVQVITVQSAVKKITQVLNSRWPEMGLRRLEFAAGNQLQVAVSEDKSRLQTTQENAVRALIRQQLPWSEAIVFQRISDRQIEAAADQALAVVPGYVEKIRLTDKLTYRITGELDDAQLQKVKQSITGFNTLWGNSYVDFVISQKHDWLKDKSFKYGDEGYIKLKPGHWYFSKPLFQE